MQNKKGERTLNVAEGTYYHLLIQHSDVHETRKQFNKPFFLPPYCKSL